MLWLLLLVAAAKRAGHTRQVLAVVEASGLPDGPIPFTSAIEQSMLIESAAMPARESPRLNTRSEPVSPPTSVSSAEVMRPAHGSDDVAQEEPRRSKSAQNVAELLRPPTLGPPPGRLEDLGRWTRAWAALFPAVDGIMPGVTADLRAEVESAHGTEAWAKVELALAAAGQGCSADVASHCQAPVTHFECYARLVNRSRPACQRRLGPSLFHACEGELGRCPRPLAYSPLDCLVRHAGPACAGALSQVVALKYELPRMLGLAGPAPFRASEEVTTLLLLAAIVALLLVFRPTSQIPAASDLVGTKTLVYNDIFVRLTPGTAGEKVAARLPGKKARHTSC